MSAGPSNNTVANRTLELATQVEQLVKGTPYGARARGIVERLQGPMRVAIAGRVKAGKSTLLNALVGERLAPTDAGECTRLISWYRHGIGYRVAATLSSGDQRELSFSRDGGALDIKLGDLSERDVSWLDVQWPASTLKDVTLIDTPGLASINDDNSRRTRDFLEHDDTNPTDADAVIYLMRHLHRSDVEFLDAFMDRSVTAASPVNAVAVLSRADEIGAGRLDAIDSARRIAERYRNDPAVHRLAATVMPIAGLLAETGLTMLESEAAALRTLAATPDDVLERMLLDAEGFADVHASELTVEARRHLLERLGMFGVRVAVREVRAGRTTAAQLGPQLVEISGLGELRRVIAQHFLPRARVLQARSALSAVRALARELRTVHAAIADQIDRHAEQLEASAVEFSQIRAAHLVASGVVDVSEGDRRELQTLLLGNGPSKALGLDDGVGPERVRDAALRTVTRWRNRAADPLAEPRMVEVAEAAARTGESLYAAAAGS
jgi:hypothetical protein